MLLFGEKIMKGLALLANSIIKDCNLRSRSFQITPLSYYLCVIQAYYLCYLAVCKL